MSQVARWILREYELKRWLLPDKSEADNLANNHSKLLENPCIDPDERSLNLRSIACSSIGLFQTLQPSLPFALA